MSTACIVAVLTILMCLAGATSTAAQQLAYVSAPTGTGCTNQPENAGCTLAQILVVNTVTQQVQGSIRLASAVQRVKELLVHHDGRRLYAVIDGCGAPAAGGPSVGCPGLSRVNVFDTGRLTPVTSFTVNGPSSDCALSPDG